MDPRRLTVVMLVFAAALLGFWYFVDYQAKTRQNDQHPATQPATQPVTWSTTQPATQPVTWSAPAKVAEVEQPLAAKPETSVKPATPGGPKIFTDGIGSERIVKIGSLQDTDEFLLALDISNRAAGVCTAKLTKYFATVADKKRHDAEAATYPQARLDDPEKYKGHYSVLNPVGLEGSPKRLPLETETVTIHVKGENPITARVGQAYWRRIESPADTGGESQSASFALKIYRGMDLADAQNNPLLRLIKTYTVTKHDYSITMSLTVENLTGKSIIVSLDQAGPTGLPREDIRQDMRMGAYASLHENETIKNRLKPATELSKLVLDSRGEHKIGSSDGPGPVLWVGHTNKFFGSMMYLKPTDDQRLEAPLWKAKFYLSSAAESATSRTYLTGVRIPQLKLKAGQDKTISFDVFVGPKKRSLFNNEDDAHFKLLYRKLSYIGTIDFSSCTFDWLTLLMMGLLDMFSKVALGNYGVAIIMLVLLVRLLLHPLTKKSQVSMMGMQKLGPQMQKLKEKYADDKTALNKEMMALYKTAGASPLLGCLPMALQMPIWIALFTGLRATVELRHAAFLPIWITDLAAPDKLFTWAAPTLPFIENSFNLLPILLTIAMFLQMKFGPQAQQMAAGANEQAAQQQKMMKYMMPGMMFVFFYKAPSGLTLYIMASTFAGLLDQYFVRKHIREKEATEAAEHSTIVVPGKAGRKNRPKKPKGPFYVKGG